jgi:hypothetical protein
MEDYGKRPVQVCIMIYVCGPILNFGCKRLNPTKNSDIFG